MNSKGINRTMNFDCHNHRGCHWGVRGCRCVPRCRRATPYRHDTYTHTRLVPLHTLHPSPLLFYMRPDHPFPQDPTVIPHQEVRQYATHHDDTKVLRLCRRTRQRHDGLLLTPLLQGIIALVIRQFVDAVLVLVDVRVVRGIVRVFLDAAVVAVFGVVTGRGAA